MTRMFLLAFLLVLPVFIPPLGQTAGWPTSPPPTQPPSAQSLGECITFSSADNPIDMSKGVVRNLCMQPLAHAWVLNYPPTPHLYGYALEGQYGIMGDTAIEWLYDHYSNYCNPNVPQSGPDGCSWVFGPFADAPYQYVSAAIFVTNTPYDDPLYEWWGPAFVPFFAQPICPRNWNWQYTVDVSGQNYTTVCVPQDSFRWEYAQSASMGNVEGNCVSCNPVDLIMGYKQDDAVDLANNSPFPIVWQRHYRGLWRRWFFDYDRKLLFPGNIEGQGQRLDRLSVILRREDGQVTPFVGTKSNHVWTWVPNMTNPSLNPTILVKLESDENLTSFVIRNHVDQMETYNGQGQLVSLEDARRLPLVFSYDDEGRMTRIDDASGRFIDLTYPDHPETVNLASVPLATSKPDLSDFPETVSDGVHTVAYVFTRNQDDPEKKVVLSQVIKPDGQVITYNHDSFSHLTGITDEAGSRYSVYSYLGNSDQVSSTYHGDHHETATYGIGVTFPGTRTNYISPGGPYYNRLGGMDSPCTYCKSVMQKRQINYDPAGNPTQRLGFNWRWEERVYDQERGLPLTITEGKNNIDGVYNPNPNPPPANAPDISQTRTLEWDTRFRKPTKITEPVTTGDGAQVRVTLMTYDDHGNLLTRAQAVSGPSAAGQARAEAWTYNAMGEPLTHTDTRQKVARYAYDPQGNLLSVTNPLGQMTLAGGYDASGNMGWMEDPNHLKTRFVRDDLQRVIQVDKGCDTTEDAACHWESSRMTYTPFGAIASITDPTGKKLIYQYDTAHRTTGVEVRGGDGELLGTVGFELTEGGKPSRKTFKDPSGVVLQVENITYDDLNRPSATIDSHGGAFSSTRDDEGNVVSTVTPSGRQITRIYDALNRLVEVRLTGSNNGWYLLEQRQWGTGDELLSQSDGYGRQTSYVWNGFGDRVSVLSPDSGTNLMTYDAGHNLVSRTDARGRLMTVTHDELGRPLIQTGASGETVSFGYDDCPFGAGRLCMVTDHTGVTRFAYDRWGRVTLKRMEVENHVFELVRGYDDAGNLASRTTPVRTIGFTSKNGEVTGMSDNVSGPLVSMVRHDLTGRLLGWMWPTGLPESRTFDPDGRQSEALPGCTPGRALSRNADGQISGISVGDGVHDQSFTYDNMGRLWTSAVGDGISPPTEEHDYFNNVDGNRSTVVVFGSNMLIDMIFYSYNDNSDQLSQVFGMLSAGGLSYDADGNTTTLVNGATLEFDDWNFLRVSHSAMGDTVYGVNGLGERVSKTQGDSPVAPRTWFLYDIDGTLAATFDRQGVPLDDYAYLEGIPLNLVRQSVSYSIETDHLATPIRVVDPAGTTVWSWEYHPVFGESLPQEGVVNGQSFTLNLRMPGQYFDEETGLFHNGARDYDPQTGRYIEVDPLGLAAGMNPYVYVDGDPVNQVDPTGLYFVVNDKRTTARGSFGDFQYALDWLTSNSKTAAGIIKNLSESSTQYNVNIVDGSSSWATNPDKTDPDTNTISWTPDEGLMARCAEGKGLMYLNPALSLLHELGHLSPDFDAMGVPVSMDRNFMNEYDEREEYRVIKGVESKVFQEIYGRNVYRSGHNGVNVMAGGITSTTYMEYQ